MDLASWINDKLLEILGLSEKNTVSYILALGKSAKSESEILEKLIDLEFPNNSSTEAFSSDLYSKLSSKPGTLLTPYQEKFSQDLEKKLKNDSYELIKEECDPEQDKKERDELNNRLLKKERSARDKKQKHLDISEEERKKIVADMKKMSR